MTNENPPNAAPKKKRGRPPTGAVAMTDAERSARHRAKQRKLAVIGMVGRTEIESVWTACYALGRLCMERNAEQTDPTLHAVYSELWRVLWSYSEGIGLPGFKRKRERLRKRDGF